MNPKLMTIRARNFQGIEQAELNLGDLTLIWGANGSGKSSLLDAINWAFCGEAPRGGAVADVVRQGARGSAEVEVMLAGDPGRSIIRRRSKSQGAAFVDGVEVPAREVDQAVEALLGAPLPAVAAALRSGAILDLPSDELQALLGQLTGAGVDRDAIAAAFEPTVVEAAKRAGLPLPDALKAFELATTRAEEARRGAKRELAEREADLERLPAPEVQVPVEHQGRIEAALADLRARRDKAARAVASAGGAREEQIRALRAEAERLSAVKPPEGDPGDVAGLEARLAATRTDAARALGELAAEERRLAELRREAEGHAAEDEQLAARAHELEEQLAAAQKAREAADAALQPILAEGRQKKALLDRMPSGCVGACPVLPETTCPITDLSGLEARLRAAREDVLVRYQTAAAALKAADAEVQRLRSESEASFAAGRRVEAHAAVTRAEARLQDLREKASGVGWLVAPLAGDLERARALAEAQRAWKRAQDRIAAVRDEIAAVSAKPDEEPVDVAAIDSEIARGEVALESIRRTNARDLAEARLKAAAGRVVDADAVAKACGPDGVRAKLLARAVGPFLESSNGSLAQIATSLRLEISDEMELQVLRGTARLRPAQLSDGERQRLLWALQIAVARLAKFPLLLLDRAELLDEAGKGALKRLAAAVAREGLQVVMVSCAAPPAACPPGVVGYVVDAGKVRAVGAAQAA